MERIGEKIRTKRLKEGWSMQRLATKIGVSYKTILNVEHGRDATTKVLLAICEALKIEVSLNDKEE